ncbi:MAG: hypothetical protein GY718_10660, partial [Lentisphaerae bacterium]|nr:hypothetical protein [Lentisphaerota bacterium]
WTRANLYHPHVHFIVPGGGYDEDDNKWHPSSKKFLVPVKALSKIYGCNPKKRSNQNTQTVALTCNLK